MKVYLGLGSNLAKRDDNIKKAINELNNNHSIDVTKQSSYYETKPYRYKDQPDFINMVLEVETELSAEELLKTIKNVEENVGRKPTFKNGPRVIDIDILLYGSDEISSADLVIPHPGLTKRSFVVKPLLEVAPEIQLPNGMKIKDVDISEKDIRLYK